MATYVLGDIQGCFDQLQHLLQRINYRPKQDALWFAGDLVNRGPKSLETLRFIKEQKHTRLVLGNHDLHLLALAHGHPYSDHTLHDVLNAPDRDELIHWLRHQPLCFYDKHHRCTLVHAGIYPFWTVRQALNYAREVETILQSDRYTKLLDHMYGDTPSRWHDDLKDWERARFIINSLTRMRLCNAEGALELRYSGTLDNVPASYYAWYETPNRKDIDETILFGHWAALADSRTPSNLYALDTGCVWGNRLTALRLEDGHFFSVPGWSA